MSASLRSIGDTFTSLEDFQEIHQNISHLFSKNHIKVDDLFKIYLKKTKKKPPFTIG
jgi:hypothetical protein